MVYFFSFSWSKIGFECVLDDDAPFGGLKQKAK